MSIDRPHQGTPLHGALERALSSMTIKTIAAYERERERRRAARMSDMAQHFRVPISGKVKNYVTWNQSDINFTYPFIYAPGRAFDNHHDTPHFTSGYEHTSGDPVIVHAHVIDWKRSPQDWCIGATIRFGVQSAGSPYVLPGPSALPGVGSVPPQARPQAFQGILHLTFTGFANPVEDVVDNPDSSFLE